MIVCNLYPRAAVSQAAAACENLGLATAQTELGTDHTPGGAGPPSGGPSVWREREGGGGGREGGRAREGERERERETRPRFWKRICRKKTGAPCLRTQFCQNPHATKASRPERLNRLSSPATQSPSASVKHLELRCW